MTRESNLEKASRLRREGEALKRHAAALERETQLLLEAGYFDVEGKPIGGERGKEISNRVQEQLQEELKQEALRAHPTPTPAVQ
jgi:hypothetical protein